MNNILAVIPAYNEAEHITRVVRSAKRWLDVLVVDDGSSDDTVRLAEAAGARVLRQPCNQGKGAALRAGFRAALERDYAAVITLDGDGQHDPNEIPRFLASFAEHPSDLIIGQRNFSQMPFSRRLANTLGQALFSWAMGRAIPDNQSGYRLLSQRFYADLLNSSEQGFEFEVEMLAVCLKNEYKLAWVPIRTIYAGESSHIHPIQHVTNFVRIVWRTRQKMHSM